MKQNNSAIDFARKILPLTVAVAFFMNSLDAFVLNVAVPTIANAFNQPPLRLKLAITTYLLSMGVFIPVSGWLADRFGSRNIFGFAIFLFGLGSLACGFSQNIFELVIARLIQGVGGAMMLPVGRLILNQVFPRSEIFKLMAMIAMIGLLGPAAGPVLGGIIITYTSWRWIFLINIPFVIIGLVLVAYYVPNLKSENIKKLDWIGFILVGLGIACLGFGFSALGQQALPIFPELLLILFGIVFILLYYFHQKNRQHPFINKSIFKIPSYKIAIIGTTNFRISTVSVSFLIALMCQLALNLSPLKTALILTPFPLGLIASKPFLQRIVGRIGLRKLLVFNTFIVSFFLLMFSLLNPSGHLYLLLITLFLYGVSLSFQNTSLQTLNVVNAKPELLSQMISFANAMQQLTSSFSIAISALFLELFYYLNNSHFSINEFHHVFLINAFIILFSAISFSKLRAQDGQELLGHHNNKK